MKEPEDYINDITGFIDPFHIIIPKYDAKVRKYRDLVHRYNTIYYDIVKRKGEDWADKRGIKPMVLLEVMGPSLSLPELPLGEVAAADLTRGAAETEISEQKIEEMRDRINVINVDARMAGGGATTEPRAGYTPVYSDYVDETQIERPMYEHIRRTTNPVYTKAEAKKKYGGALINGTDVLQTLVYMFQDAKGYATEAMKKRGGIKSMVERAWKAYEDGDNDHQNHILQIINNHGLYLQGRTFKQIKEILDNEPFDASIMASMRNQILKVLQDSTDDENRDVFEPDINLEDLQVPGEIPNFDNLLSFKNTNKKEVIDTLMGASSSGAGIGRNMSFQTANSIVDRITRLGARDALSQYMEGRATMDVMENTSRSVLSTIYDIASEERELAESFRINPRLILESILGIMNVPEQIATKIKLDDFLNWKERMRSLVPTIRNVNQTEEGGGEDTFLRDILNSSWLGNISEAGVNIADIPGTRGRPNIEDIPETRGRPDNLMSVISVPPELRGIRQIEEVVRRIPEEEKKDPETLENYGRRISQALRRYRKAGELFNLRGWQIKAHREGEDSEAEPILPSDSDPDPDPDPDPDGGGGGGVEEPAQRPINRFSISNGKRKMIISAATLFVLGGIVGVGKTIYDTVMSNPEGVIINPDPNVPGGSGGGGGGGGGGSGGGGGGSGGGSNVLPGTDVDDQGNTTFVDYQNAQSMQESSGMLRASGIDPPEASLFLHTGKEARDQQRMWNEFSRVEPGFGLGSMGFNTLAQHNARADALRFKNNYKLPAKPTIIRPYKANPQIQPKLIPHYMSDFGNVILEDETPYSDYARRNQLTDERLHNNNWNQYENPNNIYMPEGRIYGFKRQPVIIPEIRNSGYDRFLSNERPSRQGSVVFDDMRSGYNFNGGTFDHDNFDKKPKKPRDKTSNAKPAQNALRFSTRF